MRVERIGNATLYLGDCREIAPTLQGVEAVVSDPPYGAKYKPIVRHSGSISTTGKHAMEGVHDDDKPFDPSPWMTYSEVVFTGAQYFYDRLPGGGSLHCWDKRGDYKPLDQSDADIVWRKSRGPSRTFHCVWRGICRHVEHDELIRHPTQKPVALMEWLVGMTSGVVLDPYMGSGTTGVACARLGRPFIGIELMPHHYDVACERIAAAQAQGRLFA